MTDPKTPLAWRRAFLRELARSGNVTCAARACGVHQSFPYQLRRRNPAFALSWDRALARAREGLAIDRSCARAEAGASVGMRGASTRETPASAGDQAPSPRGGGDLPQPSAEPRQTPASAGDQVRGTRTRRPILRADELVRSSKTGKCRIVRVATGRWSAKVEAVFLAELTATANVSAAARAAGVTLQCVYAPQAVARVQGGVGGGSGRRLRADGDAGGLRRHHHTRPPAAA